MRPRIAETARRLWLLYVGFTLLECICLWSAGMGLYEAVKAVGMELCPALGIAIPVGKDSMSMKTVWQDIDGERSVTAPLSLIATAFAPVDDVRRSLVLPF